MVLEIHIIKNQKNEGLIFIPFTCKVLKPLRLPRPVLAEHIYDPTCDLCTLLIRSAPFSTVASDRVPPSLRHVILDDVWPWTQQKNIAVSLIKTSWDTGYTMIFGGTTHSPFGPWIPTNPLMPLFPFEPRDPFCPWRPFAPVSPLIPGAPIDPLSPLSPFTPWGPTGPLSPPTPGVPVGPDGPGGPSFPEAPFSPLYPGYPWAPGGPGGPAWHILSDDLQTLLNLLFISSRICC